MNTSSKWIKVKNTKECGEASGIIFKSLTDDEKERAKNIIGHRQSDEDKSSFYVIDSALARKLFDGHFSETNKTF